MFEPEIDLRKCACLNAVFPRAPTVKIYNQNLTREDLNSVAEFCLKQVREIIEILNPKSIITIGFSMLKIFGESTPDLLGSKDRILSRKGQIGMREAIGMLHVTGPQISNDDCRLLAEYIIKSQELSRS